MSDEQRLTEPKRLPRSTDRAGRALRRAVAILGAVAAGCIVLAAVLNWRWALPAVSRQPASQGAAQGALATQLVRHSVDMIPQRVLQFETISRQPVPGMGKAAGEAVFKTLNMGVETQVDVVVYTRVEGFTSQTRAKARLDQVMGAYPQNRKQVVLNGVTRAISGEAADGSAYANGWVRDGYVTVVKTSYEEWTPVDRVDLLRRQGEPVSEAVDIFQRTGREGVRKS